MVAVTNLGIPRSAVLTFSNDLPEGAIEVGRIKRADLPEIVYSRVFAAVMDTLRSPSVFQLATGSIDLMQRELSESRLGAADLVIAPRIDDVAYYSFYEAEKMIAAGEKAAEAAVDDIRALVSARAPSPGDRALQAPRPAQTDTSGGALCTMPC